MIKLIIEYTIIFVLLVSVLSHFLKIVYLYFKPKVLEKFEFISKPDLGRNKLFLYYLLTILVCIYAINQKLNVF
jgi:hypothetical protein